MLGSKVTKCILLTAVLACYQQINLILLYCLDTVSLTSSHRGDDVNFDARDLSRGNGYEVAWIHELLGWKTSLRRPSDAAAKARRVFIQLIQRLALRPASPGHQPRRGSASLFEMATSTSSSVIGGEELERSQGLSRLCVC